jgi:plastocyanin
MRQLFRPISIVAAIAVAACGGSGSYGQTTAPPPPQNTIAATPALAFGPATLTVSAGQTVTFAFGSVAHNVFFDQQAGAPADIDGLNANVSVQRVFTSPGTYHYSCHIHPSMHGTVVVN